MNSEANMTDTWSEYGKWCMLILEIIYNVIKDRFNSDVE